MADTLVRHTGGTATARSLRQGEPEGAEWSAPAPAAGRRRVLRRPWFLPQGRWLAEPVWSQRHRGLTWLLWAHLPLLFVFAVIRGYGAGAAALQCCILIPAGLVAMVPSLSRNVRSASTSLGLVLGASVFVHLAGGSIEAHFQFFVILAFLTLYQSWLPLLVALAYVVAEHGIIGALDPSAVYNNPADIRHPWTYAAIHGAFVLAASFANILSWRLTEQEALHDGLTRLPNRTFFLDSLSRSFDGRAPSSIAVLFIDLDNFKDANDGFGHDTGDLLLQALAARLHSELRPADILARLGGDEFAIALLDMHSPTHARAVAQRILAAVSEPVSLGAVTLTPSASIGLAFGDSADSAGSLLRNADLAMYEAKRDGGGRVGEYRPILHTVALRRTELDAELRVAIEQHQLVVHYQPIFDLSTNRLVGTEALVRWQHPTRGLLPPAEFIPAAEQSGLIVPLGSWVLRRRASRPRNGRPQVRTGPRLSVSVNLAPRQLTDRKIVTTVAEALHEAGLAPSSLCLEITEGSVIKDFETTMPILNALRALGVTLALDDFGTGYSSLSYLKQLPVNSVKIDRSFVSDLDSNIDNAEIVRAIISLAHTLGMSVTAEGAETDDQLAALRTMGSDHAQGYVLGRPLPEQAVSSLLANLGIRIKRRPPTAYRVCPCLRPIRGPHDRHTHGAHHRHQGESAFRSSRLAPHRRVRRAGDHPRALSPPPSSSNGDAAHRWSLGPPAARRLALTGQAWRPRQTLLPLVALAGTAAAGVHYTVMPAHFNESALYGSFFLVAATAQLVYSVLLLCRPSRPLIAAGLAGNAAILLLWLLTRTIAIPLGPAAGETEAFGGLDILAAAFEIVFVAGACGLLHKPRLLRRAAWPPAWSPAIWIAAPIAVLAISVTAYAAPPS